MRLTPNPKINLGLAVLRKRADGFHDLETLFVPYFGIKDILEIEEAQSFSIDIPDCGWNPQDDLTARAYRLLAADFDLPPVRIYLEKHIPVGAGMGGGSSDAAFALIALNEMFGLGLSKEKLALYASSLGADCAFFIYNKPMFGSGKGDVLCPYSIDLSAYSLKVEMPSDSHVSTREAYGGIIPRDRLDIQLLPVREALSRPVTEWKDVLVNDFETTVFPLHPEIRQLKAGMYADGAVYASMSGSGSSVFGLFEK